MTAIKYPGSSVSASLDWVLAAQVMVSGAFAVSDSPALSLGFPWLGQGNDIGQSVGYFVLGIADGEALKSRCKRTSSWLFGGFLYWAINTSGGAQLREGRTPVNMGN